MLLSPDGTLVVLSELECVWAQRLFPSQRAVGGGFTVFETLLGNALTGQESTIIARVCVSTLKNKKMGLRFAVDTLEAAVNTLY